MKKLFICVSVLFFCMSGWAFEGGSGTQDDPYLVAAAEQLYEVRNYAGAYFRQSADIDLSGFGGNEGWLPIGVYSGYGHEDNAPFKGVYDGNGYTIRNLYINRPHTSRVGLFAYIDERSVLVNITLENAAVSGNNIVGALAGENHGGLIENCHVAGAEIEDIMKGEEYDLQSPKTLDVQMTVRGSGDNIGGLVGSNSGTIKRCSAHGYIKGYKYIGGLAGINIRHGTIRESYARGFVFGIDAVGGLCGQNHDASIDRCYARTNVFGSGLHYAGGLVGVNRGDIMNSYATGAVSGSSSVGGLVGGNFGTIMHTYAKGPVSGRWNTGGLAGGLFDDNNIINSYFDYQTTGHKDQRNGIPRSTIVMKRQSTFREWDFQNVWTIKNNKTYPFLSWQKGY